LVFQQDKISKVLYGKNLLYDAVGGGQVASIPQVLGNQISFPLEYGISNNPESFSDWGGNIYCTDTRRGVVLKMQGDSLGLISNTGLVGFFRDEFSDKSNTQKLGAYDPHNHHYVLATNDNTVTPCNFAINKSSIVVFGKGGSDIKLFDITSSSTWAISAVDTGDGTNWVSLNTNSGFKDATIESEIAVNNTSSSRSMTLAITNCTGVVVNFLIIQGSTGGGVTVVPIVGNNPIDEPNFSPPGIYE
jgi:hypothetical protein